MFRFSRTREVVLALLTVSAETRGEELRLCSCEEEEDDEFEILCKSDPFSSSSKSCFSSAEDMIVDGCDLSADLCREFREEVDRDEQGEFGM